MLSKLPSSLQDIIHDYMHDIPCKISITKTISYFDEFQYIIIINLGNITHQLGYLSCINIYGNKDLISIADNLIEYIKLDLQCDNISLGECNIQLTNKQMKYIYEKIICEAQKYPEIDIEIKR